MALKKRNILLIEPRYKNKYPPIGLMKIATYHKMLGDRVTFYKGDVQAFIFNNIVEDCISKLKEINFDCEFLKLRKEIETLIRTGHQTKLKAFLQQAVNDVNDLHQIEVCLKHYMKYYKSKTYIEEPQWDRIYVTTLFTFYWKITIKAIEDAKGLIKDLSELKVGGVLATLLKDELEEETGIKPITGLLDQPGMLDPKLKKAQNIIIDNLPLDYSILDEIEYIYPTGSAYFTFMTKGCTRTCSFCSVPILEPVYKDKIATKDKFKEIKKLYGEQRHLLLMDNNVLASPKFPEIIQEIKDMGFAKGATFIEPNQLNIAVRNLKKGINDKAYQKRIFYLLKAFIDKRVKGEAMHNVYSIYDKYDLIKKETVTKSNILSAHKELKPIYEEYRDKAPKRRYVDFNQGTDARYVTDEIMKLISEIPIRPLRIAFDYWGMKKQYEKAVCLAAKYGIKRLSNYLLFNFKDKPEHLYRRIELNIELSEKLGIHIYSFPMKYIPLFGEDAKHRQFIGKFWKKKFIRAIQSISNVTRGIVPPGRSFFERAYGETLEEFFEILYMPETYIIYRKLFEVELGLTPIWKKQFHSLNEQEKAEAKSIIEKNDFSNISNITKSKKILKKVTKNI